MTAGVVGTKITASVQRFAGTSQEEEREISYTMGADTGATKHGVSVHTSTDFQIYNIAIWKSVGSTHKVVVRASSLLSPTRYPTLYTKLKQGPTLIAQWALPFDETGGYLTTSPTNYTATLTTPQIARITDYSKLNLTLTGDGASSTYIELYGAHLEVEEGGGGGGPQTRFMLLGVG